MNLIKKKKIDIMDYDDPYFIADGLDMFPGENSTAREINDRVYAYPTSVTLPSDTAGHSGFAAGAGGHSGGAHVTITPKTEASRKYDPELVEHVVRLLSSLHTEPTSRRFLNLMTFASHIFQFEAPLFIAAHLKDRDFFRYLLSTKEDVGRIVNALGETLLHAVMNFDYERKQEDIIAEIDLLIAKGCDLKASTHKGNTLLHYTMYRCCYMDDNKEIIKKLLSGGVDIDAVNADGETPLLYFDFHRLSEYQLDDILQDRVKYLVSKGAKIGAMNKKGATIVDAVSGASVPAPFPPSRQIIDPLAPRTIAFLLEQMKELLEKNFAFKAKRSPMIVAASQAALELTKAGLTIFTIYNEESMDDYEKTIESSIEVQLAKAAFALISIYTKTSTREIQNVAIGKFMSSLTQVSNMYEELFSRRGEGALTTSGAKRFNQALLKAISATISLSELHLTSVQDPTKQLCAKLRERIFSGTKGYMQTILVDVSLSLAGYQSESAITPEETIRILRGLTEPRKDLIKNLNQLIKSTKDPEIGQSLFSDINNLLTLSKNDSDASSLSEEKCKEIESSMKSIIKKYPAPDLKRKREEPTEAAGGSSGGAAAGAGGSSDGAQQDSFAWRMEEAKRRERASREEGSPSR